ncbi:MAG: PAC2 family protein [Thermoleophilaceae bacterium]|nr:PAC2 family protein [Thermoleophilaceae bacterium]
MSEVDWIARPQLRDPILVCAFSGWNDAGEAASAALTFLQESFEAEPVASIGCEDYFDFTETRPTIRLEGGVARVIEWPETTFHAAVIAGAEHDLVLLQSPEPQLRWRTFCRTVVEVAEALGVKMVVSLGALLADVPHSRAVSITGLASDESIVDRLGFEHSNYEGPTGIVGVVHDACARVGMPSASLWATVPHYVAAAPNPKAALALIRRFEGLASVVVEASELEDAAEQYERQVSAAVASDPDVKAFVEKLEESIDAAGDEVQFPPDIPSGDAIARDFQTFLRQTEPEDDS